MEAHKPQPRKKTLMLSAGGVVLLLAVVWIVSFAFLPEPSIQFVEFRDEGREKVAIFRITNRSWLPISFYGYEYPAPFPPNPGPPQPIGAYRVQTLGGWKSDVISPCRQTLAKCHTVAGRSSIDVQMELFRDARNAPAALGIRFQRGTAAHISSPAYMKFVEWHYGVRRLLHLPMPDYTWSNVSSAP
jgi:hypothetical protein